MEQNDYKYEAVFGDQTLFDGAPRDCLMVTSQFSQKKYFDDIHLRDCHSFNIGLSPDGVTKIAMRRIIKTPVWTADDKSSGRYPPVGVSALVPGVCVCEVIGSSEEYEQIAIKYRDGSLDVINCNELTPIETPEQLAATLRDIWVSKVCEDICYHHTGDAEVIRSISMIYEALLSGELKAPEVSK